MQTFLGIDIGGTNVKMGFVNSDGVLTGKIKLSTAELRADNKFLENFLHHVKEIVSTRPDVNKIGIGVPGTLSKDGSTLLELPNISELNGLALKSHIMAALPGYSVIMENDANAAALGEYHFAKNKVTSDFIFITLGTGVGSAAVIDGKVFRGGDGNAMELGHILYKKGKTIENKIGKKGILTIATKLLKESKGKSPVFGNRTEVTTKELLAAANSGDEIAISILEKVGEILGIALVAAIRILDIKTIIIGGGVSEIFAFIQPAIYKTCGMYLTPYYTEPLEIKLATLGNEAGIVGAASLCITA